MTKRLTIALAAAAMFQAAAPAHATIGSVISSFSINQYSLYGIYRQGNRVYLSERITGYDYIGTYTLSGSFVSRVMIDEGNPYALYGGSRTHLGAGYVAFCSLSPRELKIFRLTGGTPVTSFRVSSANNVFWDGEYYYVNGKSDKGVFVKFTRNGTPAGTWTCAGWPSTMHYCGGATYAQQGNFRPGPYFVASSNEASRPCCMTTFPGGSLISTWHGPSPGNVASVFYADSSNPATYGAAIWSVMLSPLSVVEFDIDARNASTVMPASLGKVKAIYR